MKHTRVFVFGNPDIAMDALPLKILPALRTQFPTLTFETLDPNEEWDVSKHMLIIDTIVNTKTPTIVRDLDAFMAAPRMSCHDFDAYANLMLMKKLGKIQNVTILGLPPTLATQEALQQLIPLLNQELETDVV